MRKALAGFLGALGSLSLSLSFELSRFLLFLVAGKSGVINSPVNSAGWIGLGNASETISERSSAYRATKKKSNDNM